MSQTNVSYSNSFRAFPRSVCEPFRVSPNKYEKHPVSRLIKNSPKSIQLNQIKSEALILFNPNQVFNPNEFEPGLIQTEFSIRINPKSEWFDNGFRNDSE